MDDSQANCQQIVLRIQFKTATVQSLEDSDKGSPEVTIIISEYIIDQIVNGLGLVRGRQVGIKKISNNKVISEKFYYILP